MHQCITYGIIQACTWLTKQRSCMGRWRPWCRPLMIATHKDVRMQHRGLCSVGGLAERRSHTCTRRLGEDRHQGMLASSLSSLPQPCQRCIKRWHNAEQQNAFLFLTTVYIYIYMYMHMYMCIYTYISREIHMYIYTDLHLLSYSHFQACWLNHILVVFVSPTHWQVRRSIYIHIYT